MNLTIALMRYTVTIYCTLLLLLLHCKAFPQASKQLDSLQSNLHSASLEELPMYIHPINQFLRQQSLSTEAVEGVVANAVQYCIEKEAPEEVIRLAKLGHLMHQYQKYGSRPGHSGAWVDSLQSNYYYFQDQGFDLGIAETSEALAFYYKKKGVLERSLKYALEASDLYEKLGYRQSAMRLYSQIAREHFSAQNISFAYFYVQKALASGIMEWESRTTIQTVNVLGLVYKKQEQYDSAKQWFRNVVGMAEQQQDSVWIGIGKGNLASIYVLQEQYDTALTLLKEDIYYSKKYRAWLSAINALNNVGHIYERQGNWPRALKYYEQAYQLIEMHNGEQWPRVMHETLKNLSRAYGSLGKPQKAYRFSREALAWGDSLINKSLDTSIERIQQQYEWEKQKQIITAHEAAQARELEAEQSKSVSLLVIALSLGLLFLTAIYINRRQQQLNNILKERNQEIQDKNYRIESQNEELAQQQEEIGAQHERLLTANARLQESNLAMKEEERFLKGLLSDLMEGSEQIELENRQLNEQIQARTRELITKSEELSRYTEQLESFAYVTAHNIRGPIARVKGLLNIFDSKPLHEDNLKVWSLLIHNIEEVDEIIKDLSAMLEVRTNIHESFSNVDLEDIVATTKQLLKEQIVESQAQIRTDFQVRELYTIRPYIENIIYQLVSNSIKFRGKQLDPIIKMSSQKSGENIIIQVKDNGLGLNMRRYGHQVFQMYKRFHLHTEGKGLGLHLVKVQVENLHGNVQVESKPDQGMSVTLTLPIDPGIVVQ